MRKKPALSLPENLDQIVRRLRSAPRVVYDAETNGLDWRSCKIVGHVLTFSPDPKDSFYVPVRHTGGGNIPGDLVPRFEKEVAKIARGRRDLHWGFHNGAFDLRFMFSNDTPITPEGPIEDSMINAPLIDENQRSFSLDYCCKVEKVQGKRGDALYDYIASKFSLDEAAKKSAMGHFHELAGNDPMAVEYATGDGTSTWQLIDAQQASLDTQDLRRVWAVECRLIPVLNRMTMKGIRVDEERLAAVLEITEDKIKQARKGLKDGFGAKVKKDLVEYFEKAGHTDWPKTPAKKEPSFTEAWMETFPAGQKIVGLRKFEHFRDTFMVPMRDRHLHKGRVHSEFNQLRNDEFGVLTGRLSSNSPNLQQINKRNEEIGRLNRSFFVPDEGKLWFSADYSQAEPRLLAYYSRCKALLEGYRNDRDMDSHQAVATAAGIDRESGKRANQLIITGGGANTMSLKAKIPLALAREIMAKYFAGNPEIKNLQKRATRTVEQRGYIISLLGRRSRFEDTRYAYRGMNRILQMGNADILKLKMVEVDDYIRAEGAEIDPLNNIHDALEKQFSPDAKTRKQLAECLRIMEDFSEGQQIVLDVPMVVDGDEGKTWAEATYGEEKEETV